MLDENTSNVTAAKYTGVMKTIHGLDVGLTYIEKPIMFVMSLLLFIIILWGVIARYAIHIPTPYQEELATMFHIWMCFLGISYLTSSDGHPALEVISGKVKKSGNKIFKKSYFTGIYLIMLFFVACVCYYGLTQVPFYSTQMTIYLRIPYIWLYGGGLLGMLLTSIRCVMKIVEIWAGEKT